MNRLLKIFGAAFVVALLLAFAGCASPVNPPADSLPVYRPTQPIKYPIPR